MMWKLRAALAMAGAAALWAACDRGSTGLASDDLTQRGDVPSWAGALLLGEAALSADGESTKEELPGLGRKFELLFAMDHGEDPENETNDVVSVVTTQVFPEGSGVAVRNLNPGIRITALRNQINLKYLFPTRSCAGGSPRIQVSISTDGDSEHDANAFGYVGHAPFGADCITGSWDIIDMTDDVGRWDLSQLGGGMTMTWDQAERFVTSDFPSHRVLSASLVDDSCSFAQSACGQAHYDLVTIENRTLDNRQDAVKK